MTAILGTVPLGKSIIDIGASIGRYLRCLEQAGYDVIGVDGSDGIEKLSKGRVKQFDLTSDDVGNLRGSADWGLFIEVGEHIPKEFEDKAIDNVCQMPREGLIVAWANEKAIGRDHVNCHDEDHVVEQFDRRGWSVDKVATEKARRALRRKCRHMLVLGRKKCRQS